MFEDILGGDVVMVLVATFYLASNSTEMSVGAPSRPAVKESADAGLSRGSVSRWADVSHGTTTSGRKRPLTCAFAVGDTGFEPVTSSV